MAKITLQKLLVFLVLIQFTKIQSQNSESTPRVTFTENKGQVSDQNYQVRKDVLFGGTEQGMAFHLRNNGISYQLYRVDKWKEEEAHTHEKRNVPAQTSVYRLDVTWLNTSANCEVHTGESYPGSSNYYLYTCTQGEVTGVKTYKDVYYTNIYKKIDLHYYQVQGNLKYDYIVHPGGNYKQIKFKIEGAQNISLQSNGALLINTPLGKIEEEAPVVFQNGVKLHAKWTLNNNRVGFDIEQVDTLQELIIDPVVRAWGTYYGDATTTGAWDYGYGTAVDATGNSYLAGVTGAPTSTIIATTGAHQSSFGGGIGDAFLAKFNSAGIRLWATYYGGPGYDSGLSCATDLSSNVYLTGETAGNNGTVIATPGSFLASTLGGTNAFLVKFNSSGTRIWGTYYGSGQGEVGYSVATDSNQDVYITGITNCVASSNAIATSGGFQPLCGGGTSDAFLVKFSSAGARLWGTFYGGTGVEYDARCCTDASNNVYLSGTTSSTNTLVIATATAHQGSHGGGTYDGYLAKFNSSGVRQWATYYGGSAADQALSCAADASGNIYLAGYTASSGTAIATASSHQPNSGGSTDAYLVKFNAAGVRQWGTFYGGAAIEYGEDCATDAGNNVYLCGRAGSASVGVVSTLGSFQTAYVGSSDGFVAKFDASGVRGFGTYYGSTGTDYAHSCAVESLSGNIFLAGETNSPSGMASANGHQPSYAGARDAFLAKLIDCSFPASPGNTTPIASLTVCEGNSTTLTATNGTASINWYNAATGTTPLFTGNSFATPTLATGVYTFYASAFTCIESVTRTAVSITVNPNPAISVSNGTICTGNSFTLTPTGAASYTIQGGSAVVAPLLNTTYTITGTGANGCKSQIPLTASVTVLSNPTIAVNSGSICTGQNFTISPTGAVSYTIQGGSAIVSPASATNYTVRGASSAGCISVNTATSIVTIGISPTITVPNGTICQGAPYVVQASGAFNYTYSGNVSPLVTPTITSTYTIIGENINGCLSQPVTMTVYVNPRPTVSVTSGSICSGNSFTIVPSGATIYTIQGGASVVSPSATSNYTVKGSSGGCTSLNTATATVTVNTNPTITVNSGSICSGSSFSILPSGASTYTIQGGSSVVSPTISTSYTVSGTSSLGCLSVGTATASVALIQSPTITVNSGSVCAGINFSINPTGAFTYTIEGGSSVVSPTATSSYTVAGTNTAGCVSVSAAVCNVTVNPLPNISVNSGSICPGANFTIVPTGANTYTIQSGSFIVSPTVNSTYTVTGSSAAGCVANAPATSTIILSNTPTITVNSGTVCQGNSFTISPSGANTYTVQGGSYVVSPTASTAYTVTGTNAAGCLASMPATTSVNVIATPSITVSNGSLCAGNSFTLSPSGALTYTIQGGTSIVTPTASGVYTITGSNAQGCVAQTPATASITVYPRPIISVNSGSICSGSSFTLNPSGASTYTVHGGLFVIAPLISSSYTLSGTSAQGCLSNNTATASILVNNNPTITVGNGTICSGGVFTISPSGAFTYSIQGGSFAVSPASSASYTIAGTSTAGCLSASTATANITVNSNPTITVNSGSICSGGSFSIVPSGAVAYTIQGGIAGVSPTISTSYSVIGVNTQGCFSQPALTNVTVNPLPLVSVNSGSLCSGNSFTLVPSGANTYTISAATGTVGNIISPASSSIYSVSGTNSFGCVSATTATSNIIVSASPTIIINSGAICPGNSYTLIPGGAFTYTYLNGGPVVVPAATTSYSVIGTGSAGCVATNTAVAIVTVTNSLLVGIAGSSVICNGQTLNLTATGASSYTWNTGSNSFSISSTPSANATYSVVGASGSCSNTSVFSVTVNPTPSVSVNSGSICSGNAFTIQPSGATTYTIQGGSTIVSPSTNSSYTVAGANSLGCISQIVVSTVQVATTPTLTIASGSVCSGQTYTLNPSGANTYTFSSGTSLVSPLLNSTYTISGTSSQGCPALPVVCTVTVNQSPTISVPGTTICPGTTFTLNPSGANSYVYLNGGPVVSPLVSTVYSVTGSSSVGCVASNTALAAITVTNNLPVSISGASAVCSGSGVVLAASGAASYTWNTGAAGNTLAASPLVTTVYSVTGASGTCSNSATFTLAVNPSPTVLISANTQFVCSGAPATLIANGAQNYVWNTGAGTSTIQVFPSSSTVYSVTGSIGNCSNSAVYSLSVNPVPTLSVSGVLPVLCVGESATLSVSGAVNYTWSSGATTPTLSISPLVTSTINVTGEDANGCSATAIVTQSVSECTGLVNTTETQTSFKPEIYPNPSFGLFNLKMNGVRTGEKVKILVYNNIGQMLNGYDLIKSDSELDGIDLSGYAAGIYFVNLSYGQKNYVLALLKN
ncbi:MAG: T9SS type A sorting domain-containing protein [Bacteroidia bacterium]|nr:T9SS type A sorting domain-containing protein [Bacteroidia bacterium]